MAVAGPNRLETSTRQQAVVIKNILFWLRLAACCDVKVEHRHLRLLYIGFRVAPSLSTHAYSSSCQFVLYKKKLPLPNYQHMSHTVLQQSNRQNRGHYGRHVNAYHFAITVTLVSILQCVVYNLSKRCTSAQCQTSSDSEWNISVTMSLLRGWKQHRRTATKTKQTCAMSRYCSS